MDAHWLLSTLPFESYTAYLDATSGGGLQSAKELDPDKILEEILRSGLRGRGGAGFPTGVKWRSIRSNPCKTRTVVCNAAEGEPGTFKDRFILRQNPYALLEGILIAARVVETRHLYVALKGSFEIERQRLVGALGELERAGALSEVEVEVVPGPEEYLFGEEKALLNVIEGSGPLPREAHYPPYERGLFAKPGSENPALVNNVETFAHIPSIVRHGGESFRQLGTGDTPGTCVFTISGDVKRPGVYEREAGITLHELFCQVAGGPKEGRTLVAAMSGVASKVIPAERFHTPADFGALHLIGAGLGSAGFMVFDDAANMPRVAQAAARFLYVESCNQCVACKHGLRRASSALDALMGESPEHLEDYQSPAELREHLLEQVVHGARGAPRANRCYLPVQGSLMLPSLRDAFPKAFADLDPTSAPRAPRYTLPKIVDYEPEKHRFNYDEMQAFKRSDWTYKNPPSDPPPAAQPATEPDGDIAVRLAPDVQKFFELTGDKEAIELERQVNAALRQWWQRPGRG